jgi:hypothetical protein
VKKFLSIIIPSLIILALICIDHFIALKDSLYIVVWIYLGFPIAFILQGIICSNWKSNMMLGLLLSSISVIIPISIWYNLRSLFIPVIIYMLLGIFTYFITNKIKKSFIVKNNIREKL